MAHPWVQVISGTQSFVLDFLPFESTLADDATLTYSGLSTSPSILSVIGDNDIMPTAGMSLKAIHDLTFKVYVNTIHLHPGDKVEQELPCQATQYPLKNQNSKGFLYRASHLLSDVICFRADNFNAAANEIIEWTTKCLKLELIDRPAACVLLRGIDYQGPDELLKELETALEKSIRTKSIKSLKCKEDFLQVFRNLEVYRVGSLEEPFPDGVIGQLTLSRRLRIANRHFWAHDIFSHLAKNVISHTAINSSAPLRFVNILDMTRLRPVVPSGPWLIKHWKWWFRLADSLEMMTDTMFPIIASCLARNSVTMGHVFRAEEVFSSLYRPLIEESIVAQTVIEKRTCIRQLQIAMRRCSREFERKDGKYSHIKALQKQSHFFRRTSSREMCFACFLSPSSIHLPCTCTLCESCCRAFGKRIGATLYGFRNCPLCCQKHQPAFTIRLPPATTGYRVLSLDGGGIRGIIQLDIISHLEDKIGLPIQLFVDLVVGTSVGGINALAIGKLQWPIERCKNEFIKLSQSVFKEPNSWLDMLGDWPKSLGHLARSLVYDGIYDLTGIENALKQAFGHIGMIGPGEIVTNKQIRPQIKVAVTTTETKTSKCSLLTTYNKTSHKNDLPYLWAQESGALPDLKVWEAARSTSAAPYFFPAKRFDSTTTSYEDGFNMPLPQAISEGRELWPYKVRPDFHLSIGCGNLRAALNLRSSWVHRFAHWMNSELDGHQQYQKIKLVTNIDDQCDRIDPLLDMDEVRLDKVESMAQLRKELKSSFSACPQLRVTVDRIVWKMIGTLFYFEFLELPQLILKGPNNARLQCRGLIACRYEDDPHTMSILKRRYGEELIFSVNGHPRTYENCKDFYFELPDWNAPFKIKLGGDHREALISGFPECAAKLIALQREAGQELFVGHKFRKRKSDDDSLALPNRKRNPVVLPNETRQEKCHKRLPNRRSRLGSIIKRH